MRATARRVGMWWQARIVDGAGCVIWESPEGQYQTTRRDAERGAAQKARAIRAARAYQARRATETEV